MASRASNPDHKKILTNLARTWLSLAIELETSSPLLDKYPQPKGHGRENHRQKVEVRRSAPDSRTALLSIGSQI
jgi:hypothetical protein